MRRRLRVWLSRGPAAMHARGRSYPWYLLHCVVWPRLVFGLWTATWPRFPIVAGLAVAIGRRGRGGRRARVGRTLGATGTPVRAADGGADVAAIQVELERLHSIGIAGVLTARRGAVPTWARTAPRFDSGDRLLFQLLRDRDRSLFAAATGRPLTTYARARREIAAAGPWGYGPVDFGLGVTAGRFWSTGSGTGRWETFNRHHMPDVTGMRILGLGANNASMLMPLLRLGAREVVAFELDPERARRALLVQHLFEWRDARSYALDMRVADMRDVIDLDIGRFDLVTALCSLYYVPADDLTRLLARLTELAPAIVAQANRNRAGARHAGKSVGYLRDALSRAGWVDVRVVGEGTFPRPLLFARASPARADTATAVDAIRTSAG
jgi:hypothetical protein